MDKKYAFALANSTPSMLQIIHMLLYKEPMPSESLEIIGYVNCFTAPVVYDIFSDDYAGGKSITFSKIGSTILTSLATTPCKLATIYATTSILNRMDIDSNVSIALSSLAVPLADMIYGYKVYDYLVEKFSPTSEPDSIVVTSDNNDMYLAGQNSDYVEITI